MKIHKIRTQIILMFSMTSFIMLISVGTILYETHKKIILDKIEKNLSILIYQNKYNIEAMLSSIEQSTIYLFTDRNIGQILASEKDNQMNTLINNTSLRQILFHYLNTTIQNIATPHKFNFFINPMFSFSNNFSPVYIDDVKLSSEIFSGKNMTNYNWYRETLKKKGGLHTSIGNEKNFIRISRAIKNINIQSSFNNDFIGVIELIYYKNVFTNFFEKTQMTPNTIILLETEEGVKLYENNPDNIFSQIKHNKSNYIKRCDKENYFIGSYHLKWGWNLYYYVPYGDVLAELKVSRGLTYFIIAFSFFIFIIITIIFSGTISKPILELSYIMKTLKNPEDFKYNINEIQLEEVKDLYYSFQVLIDQVLNLIKNNNDIKEREKKAELHLFQSQINPHFIYNTLDSIGWIALRRNQPDISDNISTLADILRYSLKDYDKLVSIEEEIEFLGNFLEIVKFRFGELPTVKIKLSKQNKKILIPKFTLQPLIENCILHGFDGEIGSHYIEIVSTNNNKGIYIKVIDDGVGANCSVLNNYINDKITFIKNSDGFCIRNVNQRLKLHFGDNSYLKYKSNKTGGVTAIIKIPAN